MDKKGISLKGLSKHIFPLSTKIILLPGLLFLLFYGIAGAGPIEDCQEHAKYGVPSSDPVLLCREVYLLSHSSEYKVPVWVAYHLTSEYLSGTAKRSSEKFRPDSDLPKGERAELKDYAKSGYDKGHMMPAADAKRSKKAMSETFLLSNIAPQVGVGFNRGIWEELERKVDKWAQERSELYVYVGPVFVSKKIKTIGPDHVAVPTLFFKVVYDPNKQEVIAFVFPNLKLERGTIPYYITSVDYIESLTGLDFLAPLDDEIENKIEAARSEMW
ncbi:MAG: DNA/RNA non-specific endonuclease [Patescibacteria group bacterium]